VTSEANLELKHLVFCRFIVLCMYLGPYLVPLKHKTSFCHILLVIIYPMHSFSMMMKEMSRFLVIFLV